LRNVLSAAAAASPSAELSAQDVERAIERLSGRPPPPARRAPPPALVELVDRCDGNLSAAARALGVPRSTLRDRLRGPAKIDRRRRPPPIEETG
jgi:transcriptional regulator of acetoin/glycerol metabolism